MTVPSQTTAIQASNTSRNGQAAVRSYMNSISTKRILTMVMAITTGTAQRLSNALR